MKFKDTDIAIIGYAVNFPMCNTIDEFWKNLVEGKNCISHDGYKDENKDMVYAYGRLNNIYDFDAKFFKILERDAEKMDPQQRKLIELCYEAMENAGHKISENNKIGIFAGCGDFSYVWKQIFTEGGNPEQMKLLRTAYLDSSFTLQASYCLGTTGPSLLVKTACASGLTSIHLAIESLLNDECDFAIAGGVSITEEQSGYLAAEGTISKSGVVRPFDKYADGFVPGNGAGLVVLRRIKDSIKDNDCIHAVIKGSAVNNDGKRKSGYSAPSVQGEGQAIEEAIKKSGINSNEISYIETHGTATKLGDIIEIEAIKNTYCKSNLLSNKARVLGSIKSNFGHLNYAAGIAGVIKTVLMLENKKLVPTINYQQENKELALKENNLTVNKAYRNWDEEKRVAGVSSFGIGGSNCHIILEEYNVDEIKEEKEKHKEIIPLSAKTKESLNMMIDNLKKYCEENKNTHISDISYTLQYGREMYDYRTYFVADSVENLIEKLQEKTQIYKCNSTSSEDNINIFLFPGSNSYDVSEVKKLIDKNSTLKKLYFEAFDSVKKVSNFDMKAHLDKESEDLFFRYMLTFCTEYALAKYAIYIGVSLDGVMGYSAGEYMAAYFAGVISLEDAFKICEKRFYLFKTLDKSSMVSIMSSEEAIKDLLIDSIEVSAINSKGRIMVSGSEEAIEKLTDNLSKRKILYVKLPLARAGHCSMVKKIIPDMKLFLEGITFNEIEIPFISSYLGREVDDDEICKVDYWINQTLNMVNFKKAVESLEDYENVIAIEMSIGEQLSSFFTKSAKGKNQNALSMITEKSLNKEEALYLGIGKMWALKDNIIWDKVRVNKGKRIPIPTYPFLYKEYKYKTKLNTQKKNNTEIAIVDGLDNERFALSEYLIDKYKKVNFIECYDNMPEILDLENLFREIEEDIVNSSNLKCLAEIEGLYETYDNLCLAMASDYFKEFHLFVNLGEKIKYTEVIERTKVIKEYEPLLRLFLKFLNKFDFIKNRKDEIEVIKSIESINSLNDCINKEVNNFPEFKLLMELLINCNDSYKEVLGGRKSGKEILFPGGSYDLIRKVYDETPTYSKSNLYAKIYAKILKAIASKHRGKIRILEIGGGTGIVTWPVLEELKEYKVEYWFTDIGRTFIYEAKKKAENLGYKNIEFRKVDVTKSLIEQDIKGKYFDIVVSCGVIQSLKNMEEAIKNIKEVLRDDGVLSLLQPINTHEIREFFGGLTPEWWNYEGDELRKDGYNISSDKWRNVFKKNKFEKVVILDGTEEHLSDSAIILGQLNKESKKLNEQKVLKEENTNILFVDSYKENEFINIIKNYEESNVEVLYPKYLNKNTNIKVIEEKKEKNNTKNFEKEIDIRLSKLLEEVLGFEVADFSLSIFDLDIDSLTGLMLVTKINELFKVKISPKELIQCSTLRKLSDLIESKIN